jgi:hypothetical protein
VYIKNKEIIIVKKEIKKQWVKESFLLKVIAVFTLSFGIRLFFSCTPPDPIEMNYNTLSLLGIDNSGRYIRSYSPIDTMYAEAVALELTVSDSIRHYAQNFNKIVESVSFAPAMATSIDYSFIPVSKIEEIKVITLFDIDNEIKAGDDISQHILYAMDYNFEMYKNSHQAIAELNGVQSNPSCSIGIILKKMVKNTKAQFKVIILLDNNQELSCLSDTLTMIIP